MMQGWDNRNDIYFFPLFQYSVSEANLVLCGYHLNASAANVHFVVIYGESQNDVFYALRDFLTSKRVNHSFGSAMIAMREWLSLEPIRTFMEKQRKLIPKPLIKTQKLCVFDHYSIVPTFHYSNIPLFHVANIKKDTI